MRPLRKLRRRVGVVLFRLAERSELTGRWRWAAVCYGAAVRLDPDQASWAFRLGRAREETTVTQPCYFPTTGLRLETGGDWLRAATAYSAAIGLEPSRASYRIRLARALEKLGDFRGAAESVAVLREQPGSGARGAPADRRRK